MQLFIAYQWEVPIPEIQPGGGEAVRRDVWAIGRPNRCPGPGDGRVSSPARPECSILSRSFASSTVTAPFFLGAWVPAPSRGLRQKQWGPDVVRRDRPAAPLWLLGHSPLIFPQTESIFKYSLIFSVLPFTPHIGVTWALQWWIHVYAQRGYELQVANIYSCHVLGFFLLPSSVRCACFGALFLCAWVMSRD